MILIRAEIAADRDAIHRVNAAAFETEAEAKLVDALRASAQPFLSFVAIQGNEVIGHILYTGVVIEGRHSGLGLAPMSVLTQYQRTGVGSLLARETLKKLRKAGYPWVVVLGHPEYYPRFGFVPSVQYGIGCEYDAPVEAFMVLELQPGALKDVKGIARFHEAFKSV